MYIVNVSCQAFIPDLLSADTLSHMAKTESDGKRYFVELSPETRRRLDHLAVDARVRSTEKYAGQLLTEMVNRLWAKFDPKKKG